MGGLVSPMRALAAPFLLVLAPGCASSPAANAEPMALQRPVELDQAAWLLGSWSIDVWRIDASGAEEVWLEDQVLNVTFERDRLLLRFDVIYPTQPLEAQVEYLTFDVIERRWVWFAFSNTGYRDLSYATGDFGGSQIVFESEFARLGQAQRTRQTFDRASADEFEIATEEFADGRWRRQSRARYTRLSSRNSDG